MLDGKLGLCLSNGNESLLGNATLTQKINLLTNGRSLLFILEKSKVIRELLCKWVP